VCHLAAVVVCQMMVSALPVVSGANLVLRFTSQNLRCFPATSAAPSKLQSWAPESDRTIILDIVLNECKTRFLKLRKKIDWGCHEWVQGVEEDIWT
jgi:hypothetical protein